MASGGVGEAWRSGATSSGVSEASWGERDPRRRQWLRGLGGRRLLLMPSLCPSRSAPAAPPPATAPQRPAPRRSRAGRPCPTPSWPRRRSTSEYRRPQAPSPRWAPALPPALPGRPGCALAPLQGAGRRLHHVLPMDHWTSVRAGAASALSPFSLLGRPGLTVQPQ